MTERVLKRISLLSKSIESYKADFKVITNEDGKVDEIEGHMKFKWPNLIRQEMRILPQSSQNELVVTNGRVKWIYMPHLNVAQRYDLEAMNKDAQETYGLLADYIDEESIRYVGADTIEAEEVYVLEGHPSPIIKKRDPKHPSRAKFFVGIKDGLVRKVAFYDQQENEAFSQIFWNIREDKRISLSDFEFTPPEGVRVFQVTDTGLAAIETTISPSNEK